MHNVYFSPQKKANCIILPSTAFLYAMLFYAKYLAASDNVAAMHLGLVGTFLSIVMTASPLVTVVGQLSFKCFCVCRTVVSYW